MNARRTVVRLTFAGVDISADINKHLLSLTYTDNEEDKTDDLQLSLDDREGVWLGKWLNTPSASKGVEISAVIVHGFFTVLDLSRKWSSMMNTLPCM